MDISTFTALQISFFTHVHKFEEKYIAVNTSTKYSFLVC